MNQSNLFTSPRDLFQYIFHRIDRNNNGVIDKTELIDSMFQLTSLTEEDVQLLYHYLPPIITKETFIHLGIEEFHPTLSKDKIKNEFQDWASIQTNDTSLIDLNYVARYLLEEKKYTYTEVYRTLEPILHIVGSTQIGWDMFQTVYHLFPPKNT